MSNEVQLTLDQERRALLIATSAAASIPLISTISTLVSTLRKDEQGEA